jgi:MFS family permease
LSQDTRGGQFSLLGQRRFGPFFLTQFLGAANDNLFKFAFTVLVTYHLQVSWLPPKLAGLVIGALFILPFLLMSATAGQWADKHDKAFIMRSVKLLEIGIMVLAGLGFWLQLVPLLLACVLLMGLHSTLFGPVKYAYLPQHLDTRELTGGNGMVEMGTFVAILLGNVAGGLLMALPEVGSQWVGGACLSVAVLGWLAARAIPASPSSERDLAQPEVGGRLPQRVPFAAGHFVDVVLRCGLLGAVPIVCARCAGRRRACGLAAAGGVFCGHCRRLAEL